MENSTVLITSKYYSLKYETSWNGWKVPQKSSIFFFFLFEFIYFKQSTNSVLGILFLSLSISDLNS